MPRSQASSTQKQALLAEALRISATSTSSEAIDASCGENNDGFLATLNIWSSKAEGLTKPNSRRDLLLRGFPEDHQRLFDCLRGFLLTYAMETKPKSLQ